jgi:hypothetical protein
MKTTDSRPEIELFDQFREVAGLVAPVHAPPGQIGAAQPHLRMPVDRLQRHRLVVLADDADLHTAVAERLQRRLKGDIRLADMIVPAEPDPFPAGLADHAAPERVVEIDHDELASGAQRTRHRGFEVGHRLLKDAIAVRHFSGEPHLRGHRARPCSLKPRGGIENEDGFVGGETVGKRQIHVRQKIPDAKPRPPVEHAVSPIVGRQCPCHHEDETGTRRILDECGSESLHLLHDPVEFDLLQRQSLGKSRDDGLGPRPDHAEIDLVARRVEQRGIDLAERPRTNAA